jgi:hypothetical protein
MLRGSAETASFGSERTPTRRNTTGTFGMEIKGRPKSRKDTG